MAKKIHLDESAVVDMYERVETLREVAVEFNVSDETIRRILKRHGIKRTHRHPELEPKVKKSHCRSKYCPALIVMLHNAFGWNAKQIAESTGYSEDGARSVLSKRGVIPVNRRVSKDDLDLDQIEREYLGGATTYELGEKYGVSRRTISDWMRGRGTCLGKGAHQEGRNGRTKANDEFVYSERMQELNQLKHEDGELRFIRRLAETQGGRFEYVGGFRGGGRLVATVRCVECGHEFVHGITDMDKKTWQCPKCIEAERVAREQERKQESDARRYERMFAEIREYSLDKTCVECGSTFHNASATALYCSDKCRRRCWNRKKASVTSGGFRHYYHVKYGDAYREHYDPSITLKALYERDGGICQICGEPCDWDDKEWGCMGPTYPSIDHIVPRAKGGDHFWSNVQLTHFICNSKKGARTEVMLNAS